MRKIKFRSWDLETKEMSYDFLNKNWLLVCTKSPFVELMQFTGLYDKNKKEIYEGDILKCKRSRLSYNGEFDWMGSTETYFANSVIEWWESFSNIGYRLRDGKGKTMMVKPSSLNKMEVEVIGNIHENPDMLKKWDVIL